MGFLGKLNVNQALKYYTRHDRTKANLYLSKVNNWTPYVAVIAWTRVENLVYQDYAKEHRANLTLDQRYYLFCGLLDEDNIDIDRALGHIKRYWINFFANWSIERCTKHGFSTNNDLESIKLNEYFPDKPILNYVWIKRDTIFNGDEEISILDGYMSRWADAETLYELEYVESEMSAFYGQPDLNWNVR